MTPGQSSRFYHLHRHYLEPLSFTLDVFGAHFIDYINTECRPLLPADRLHCVNVESCPLSFSSCKRHPSTTYKLLLVQSLKAMQHKNQLANYINEMKLAD
jgi:hypothetical protein